MAQASTKTRQIRRLKIDRRRLLRMLQDQIIENKRLLIIAQSLYDEIERRDKVAKGENIQAGGLTVTKVEDDGSTEDNSVDRQDQDGSGLEVSQG